MIEQLMRRTRRRFIAAIILAIAAVVALSWGVLQIYNTQEIAAPSHSEEVHNSIKNDAAVIEYLEEQHEFEAHFITLASNIKELEAERITRALALTSVVAILFGSVLAYFVARRLTKPVVEAYEAQERFIQDAAHELRNPLAAMTIALQQAEKVGRKDALTTTFKRQTKRLININEDLLFLERQQRQEPMQLNLSDLLEDVLEELQPHAMHKKVKISLQSEPNIEKKMARGDFVRLSKNIIDNAIKYSKPKTEVTIALSKDRGSILLKVTDQGIGIPESELNYIGDRFFRAKNTGKINGTGLGLAIVRKILNIYGGDILIDSVEGSGTTVAISLPT
jgi:two-component system sensor histidine kinase CiaH